jgi:hypothetical protein
MVVGEGLGGRSEDVAGELVQKDDQPDLLRTRHVFETVPGRGSRFRKVDPEPVPDQPVGPVVLAEPHRRLVGGRILRRLQNAEPEFVNVVKDSRIHQVLRQKGVLLRIAAESVPSSR